MKHSKLTALIFIALILGVIVGHFAPDFAVKMKPFAVIFLRMVKMIIAPLLFATLVVGIAGHGDAKSLGKIGLKTIIYFEIVTTLALIIGLTMANIFKPGVGFVTGSTPHALHMQEAGLMAATQAHTSVSEMVTSIFPTSIIDAMAQGNLLQIVVFSIFFALAIVAVGKSAKPVLDILNSVIVMYQQEIQKLDKLIQARFVEMFGDPIQNPYNWSIKSLLEMGYCKNGMNFHTGDSGIELYCLGVGDFKNYSIIDGTDQLSKISLNEMPPEESMLHNGDIVLVRSNGNKDLVGRCVLVYPHDVQTTYSGFCIRYRLTSREVNKNYLLRVLKTDSMSKQMTGRGANIQNLNQKTLATLIIPKPPIELQNQFADFVASIDKSK